jgi:hypothetical protein
LKGIKTYHHSAGYAGKEQYAKPFVVTQITMKNNALDGDDNKVPDGGKEQRNAKHKRNQHGYPDFHVFFCHYKFP